MEEALNALQRSLEQIAKKGARRVAHVSNDDSE
jgi:hypothetical protein